MSESESNAPQHAVAPEAAAAPRPPATPASIAPKRRAMPGVVPVAAVLALVIALATWVVSNREIRQLQQQLADLQEAHRDLAVAVTQGKKGGTGPVGQIIDVAKAPARGNQNAPVTLIEFSDYECPFCIRHFQQTMPLIDKNYIETGRIRYVFRDFPIDSNHPQAIRAHEAARCAMAQNKFWELHTRLFSAPGTHTPLALEDRAKEAGLDVAAFHACIAAGKTTAEVRETESIAENLGATGTPWFFVGVRDVATDQVRVLKPIGGAQPYEQFVVALDSALREAEPK
jgi:protein-disulfide isomerase